MPRTVSRFLLATGGWLCHTLSPDPQMPQRLEDCVGDEDGAAILS